MLILKQLQEQNPVDIADLTESILQNLALAAAYGATEPTAENSISPTLQNLQNADLNCDYQLSQERWCDALISNDLLPWLWDLDISKVRAKQRRGNWDWELLARQLSQVTIHEPDDTTLQIPQALRNRRRIWRLLEEARIDDVAEPIIRMRKFWFKEDEENLVEASSISAPPASLVELPHGWHPPPCNASGMPSPGFES